MIEDPLDSLFFGRALDLPLSTVFLAIRTTKQLNKYFTRVAHAHDESSA